MNNYHIYPSLMDGYAYYASLEDAEAREAKRRELIDRINRVPQPPALAASRGTALNELVDATIEARGIREMTAENITCTDNAGITFPAFRAHIDGFDFDFRADIVDRLVEELYDCMCQVYCESTITIPDIGTVTLYGYADYVRDAEVIDLKTTENYAPGKYRENWQHRVYPYCLVRSGLVEEVGEFSYLVAELAKDRNGMHTAKFYTEQYVVDVKAAEEEIRRFLGYEFIPFLEDNRHLITDKKIFS